MNPGGFIGALGFLATVLGAVAAFVSFPWAYATTWPWLSSHVVSGYGPDMRAWAPWLWSGLLGFAIFSLVRSGILLVISAGGLALILKLLFGRGRDR